MPAGLASLIDSPSAHYTRLLYAVSGLDSTPAAVPNAGRLQLPNSKREPAVSNTRVHAYEQHAVDHGYGEHGEQAGT
jgi:hypothetical protein